MHAPNESLPDLFNDTPAYRAGKKVVQILQNSGHEAVFAGGCVRDALRQTNPADFDVATSARPEQIEELFEATIPVGKAFGVIIVRMDGHSIETATFRHDGPYSDGRHPDSIDFVGRVEDVKRRDFTVNGLMYDPISGVLHDDVGGRADLKNKVVRAIGDPSARFEEDRLRMLRAVRFAIQLNYEIDPDTEAALRTLAPRILEVSWERIRVEFEKILVHADRSRGIRMLDECGLLEPILPELMPMKGCEQPPEFHPEGDVWKHTLLAIDQLESPSFELAFGTLLHDVGKPPTFTVTDRIRFNRHEKVGADMAQKICRRFKCSTEETEAICWLVDQHMMLKDIPNMRKSRFKRLAWHDHFEELMRLFLADINACHCDRTDLDRCEARLTEIAKEPVKPDPLVTGKDLIDMGHRPGPRFGEVLGTIEDLQLEGELSDRPEALQKAAELMQEAGGAS